MTRRPEIISIEGETDGEDARITVVLDFKDRRFYGQALGAAHPQHRTRLAGEAVLAAVENLTDSRVRLELLAVASADLGANRVALAQVRLDDDEILVGSALMTEGNAEQAAVRAVMDALNRRLALALEELGE